MNRIFFYLAIVLLTVACSRQPVRVNAPLPAPPAPASAPNAQPTPAGEAANQRLDDEVMREGPPLSRQDYDLPTPSKSDPVAVPKVSAPRPSEETNGTANIENQGNVGQAPLASDDAADAVAASPLMTMTRSACYGDCDSYTLEMRPEGELDLRVGNGLMGEGQYTRRLDPFATRELMGAIDSLRATYLHELYPLEEEPPADAQFTRLALPDKEGNLRSVTVYYAAPAALDRFIARIETLIDTEIWKPRPPSRQ